MTASQQRRGELWALMQLRRLGFGRNPLRRPADRLESLLLLGALLAALLAVPAAAAFGTSIGTAAERTAAERRAQLRPLQATTLEDTASAVPSAPGHIASRVRVTWYDAWGLPQEGRTDVVIGTKAGTQVTIWLDRNGAMARAPRQSADSAALGAAAGITTLMLAWPLLWGLFRLARLPLDRRRAQDWAREWEQVAPRWKRTQY